jgi:hypothetical protein
MASNFNLEEKKQKFDSLNKDKFVFCEFENIDDGDIVLSLTMTNSQKYFLKEGCEEYNMKKYGIMLHKNKKDPENSIILAYDPFQKLFFETHFYRNPGTSGAFYLQKYVE